MNRVTVQNVTFQSDTLTSKYRTANTVTNKEVRSKILEGEISVVWNVSIVMVRRVSHRGKTPTRLYYEKPSSQNHLPAPSTTGHKSAIPVSIHQYPPEFHIISIGRRDL